MSEHLNPADETLRLANALVGAYLIVAFSDGEFAKSEEVRLRLGQFDTNHLPGVRRDILEAVYVDALHDFRRDYDAAAEKVLALLSSLACEGLVRRAITDVSRTALIADQKNKPQEIQALGRIAGALGLPPDQI